MNMHMSARSLHAPRTAMCMSLRTAAQMCCRTA